jgi:hypothetical protein
MKIIATAGNHPEIATQISADEWKGPCISGVYEETENNHEVWFIKFKNKEQRNEFLTNNPNVNILWEQNIEVKKQTFIKWLENKIESCEELNMSGEKWVFIQCLKKLKEDDYGKN